MAVDMLVLLPVIGVSLLALTTARTTQLILEYPLAISFAVYNIYFVGHWGQTLGKMALKIKVISLDGGEAGFKRAFYRHVVDLAFSLVASSITVYALLLVTDAEYDPLPVLHRLALLDQINGSWAEIVTWISFVWVASELVVLLFNEKRRAIHDFIAGTVVIHTKEAVVAT